MNKSPAQRHFSVLSEGDIGGYPIPKEKLANTEIPRQNRRNTYTAFMIGQVYLKLYPMQLACLFTFSMYAPEINLRHCEKTWEDLDR